MMENIARLIKEALSYLLTVQEVAARPGGLSEDDKAIIVAACDKAVRKLLAADGIGHGGQATKKESEMELSIWEWIYVCGMWLMAVVCGLIAVFHTPDRRE